MNKGMGMDGFQGIMPMGDDDNLITVDDLHDSLSPENLFNAADEGHHDLRRPGNTPSRGLQPGHALATGNQCRRRRFGPGRDRERRQI